MKKVLKKAGQIITGASTAAVLWAGRVMATTIAEGEGVVEGSAPATSNLGSNFENAGHLENPALAGAQAARGSGMPSELVGDGGIFTNIINTVLLAVGAISVIMLIYGGFRYIISGGDSKKVTDAKNTILYAIIGLIISLLSYAIVSFILGALGSISA